MRTPNEARLCIYIYIHNYIYITVYIIIRQFKLSQLPDLIKVDPLDDLN